MALKISYWFRRTTSEGTYEDSGAEPAGCYRQFTEITKLALDQADWWSGQLGEAVEKPSCLDRAKKSQEQRHYRRFTMALMVDVQLQRCWTHAEPSLRVICVNKAHWANLTKALLKFVMAWLYVFMLGGFHRCASWRDYYRSCAHYQRRVQFKPRHMMSW